MSQDVKVITDEKVLEALERYNAIGVYLRSKVFERADEIKTAMLALLSRQHCIYLGPPGTGKSFMIRELCDLITGFDYFEYLMNAATKPGELFGNPTIESLKQGSEERDVTGMFPTCHIGFLDEFFEGSVMILNSLLSQLNERKFHNGRQVLDVPLISCFMASNRIPDDPVLAAIYDRILFRHTVDYLKEDGSFVKMIMGQSDAVPKALTAEQLSLLQNTADQVVIPESLQDTILKVRSAVRGLKVQVSDRRYRTGMTAVKAHALMRGSMVAGDQDLIVFKHILWVDPAHKQTVQRAVMEVANVFEAQAEDLYDAAKITYNDTISMDAQQNSAVYFEVLGKLKEAARKINDISSKAKDQNLPTEHIDQLWSFVTDYSKQLVRKQMAASKPA